MIGISAFSRSYLRSRATYLMTDECIIHRPGPGNKVTYDKETKEAVRHGGDEVYEGPCRLWQVTGGGVTKDQDRDVVITTTYLSIPYDNGGEPLDIVTITGSEDPDLVGRSLTIHSVTRGGGLRGSRVFRVAFVDYEEEGDL